MVSFEPSSNAFAQLERAAATDLRWYAHRLALGTEDTWLDLQIAPLSVLNSFLPPSAYGEATFGERGRPNRIERVEVRRLDDFLATQPTFGARKVFVKLDTQGFDLKVFAGMSGLMDQVVGIQSEVSLRSIYDGAPGWLDSLAVYQNAGFRVIGMYPAATDAMGLPFEFDCLMVRDVHRDGM
jgi:FkbM family methyltransferase